MKLRCKKKAARENPQAASVFNLICLKSVVGDRAGWLGLHII